MVFLPRVAQYTCGFNAIQFDIKCFLTGFNSTHAKMHTFYHNNLSLSQLDSWLHLSAKYHHEGSVSCSRSSPLRDRWTVRCVGSIMVQSSGRVATLDLLTAV